MVDSFTTETRSKVMASIRSRGNKGTELKLVAILRTHGIKGWRRHKMLPGHPDFVFSRERLVIFVDGCLWHGCRWHFRMPQTNRGYWERKITRNIERDRVNSKLLRKSGWRVLRIWAHSLHFEEKIAGKIVSKLLGLENHRFSLDGSGETTCPVSISPKSIRRRSSFK